MARKRRNTWKQGKYVPINPNKYRGNPDNIIFRSSWEETFAKFLDGNVNVLEWASEEISIPYFNPVLKRPAHYFPDFWVRFKDINGDECVELIEIKPSAQVNRPKKANREQELAWIVNMAKWKAAVNFCRVKQIKFRILTEKSIFK